MSQDISITGNKAKIWMQATRPFSFTASITPVLIGAAWAHYSAGEIRWFLFPFFLLSSLLIHAATNLISDYEDYKRGVDKDYTYGSSGVLTAKLLPPEEVRKGAYVLFGFALLLGLIIIAFRGVPILILGIGGIAGGYFYTVSPIGYKYLALGDACVFLFMGVLLVLGVFLALTGFINYQVFLISIPISLLVTAILHANNVRDIQHDKQAGIQTFASKIGHPKSQNQYYLLIMGAYGVTLILVLANIVSVWSLIVFLSLPLALKNINTMRTSKPNKPKTLASLDQDTAKLHLLFGILFIISLLIGSSTI